MTRWALRIPTVGHALRILAVSRFSECLALQLRSGQNPMRALLLAGKASGNAVLEYDMKKSVQALGEGDTLTDSLEYIGFFPPAFIQFIRTGEETGTAPTLMASAAALYRMELEMAIGLLVAVA